MSVSMNKLALGIASSLVIGSLSAASIDDSNTLDGANIISCRTADSDEGSGTVVVYVNGIQNSKSAAEESRRALQTAISNLCTEGSCSVQKFYNKTDGRQDFTELRDVANLERNSANLALHAAITGIMYEAERRLTEQPNEYDREFAAALNELREEALDSIISKSEVVYPFEQYGTKLVEYLLAEVDQSGSTIQNSVYKRLLTVRKDIYSASFRNTYYNNLRNQYLSSREFYGSDSKSLASITKSVEGLTNYLTELIISGKEVVVVPHSQGNHVTELAYSSLRQSLTPEQLAALQVVGVASVAATSPNNTYLTWDDDHTVLVFHDNSSDSQPAQPTFGQAVGETDADINDHNFIDVYLNDGINGIYTPPVGSNVSGLENLLDGEPHSMREWLVGLIASGMDAAEAIPALISSSGFITTTLLWEGYDDMDLHTREPDGNIVYFGSSYGTYGHLDLDDRNGDGPEHYYASIDCETAAGKTWNFGVHQYPRGGSPAIAHLSVKVGGQHFEQESFSYSAWPSSIEYLATLRFGSYDAEKQLITFDLSIND